MVLGLSSLSPMAQGAVVLVLTTVLVQAVRWLLSYRAFFKFNNSLPGEKDFSMIWGNLHKIRHLNQAGRIKYFESLAKQFPRLYRFWMGPFYSSINLNHPDTIKQLCKTSEPKPMFYNMALPWLGEGLLIAKGSKWARSRRLLTPAFHFDILKPYVNVSNAACNVLVEKVQQYADEEKIFEMFGVISLATLDVILQCAMSYKDDIQTRGESHPYVQAVTELSDLWSQRSRNSLVYKDFIYNLTRNGRRFKERCDFVHSIADKIIKARKESLEKEGPPNKRYLDFLDILLTAKDDSGQGMTPEDIRSEVDTFMFEGHDTTASAISWTLFSLCEHPEVQQAVQEEVDTVLKGRDTDEIFWSDLPKLELLNRVIKEGMRLHCPVPFISRELTQPMTVDGVTFPVGALFTININNVHHNPLVWDDPLSFRPERFEPDAIKNMDSHAFVPFSAGPRNCIGQHFALNEQKVVLGRLMRRFTFSLDPNHTVLKKPSAVMRTETGMRMIATPRTPSE